MSKKVKIKKPKSMILQGVGKTPSIDWLIIIAIFVCLVIVAVTASAFRFAEVKRSRLEDAIPVGSTQPISTKSLEEGAKDVLNLYQSKKEAHLEILSKTKSDIAVEKKNAQAVATTTATSSPSGANAGTGTGTSTVKAR